MSGLITRELKSIPQWFRKRLVERRVKVQLVRLVQGQVYGDIQIFVLLTHDVP